MALDTFLNNFISSTITVLQISDSSLDSVSDDDPLVRQLAKIAYSQIVGYCNRYFEKKVSVEEYHNVISNSRIRLRNTPVSSVATVMVNDTLLVLGTDYLVLGDSLKFLNLPRQLGDGYLGDFAYAGGVSYRDKVYPLSNVSIKGQDVLVQYTGGYSYAEENNDLFSALLLQTIALYNRRSTLGMSAVSGVNGTRGSSQISGASDSGDLLESVQGILTGLINFSDVDDA